MGVVKLENDYKGNISVKFDKNELDKLLSSFKGNTNPKRLKGYEYETPVWKKIFKIHRSDHAVFSVTYALSH